MSIRRKKEYDKCCICEWEGPSDDVIFNEYTRTWHCPICNSEDVEPSDFDPYNDDEDEDDEGGPSRLIPIGPGPIISGGHN